MAQDALPEGDKTELWNGAATGLDEVGGFYCDTITSVRILLPHLFAWTLELEPWVSLWSNHFGEKSTPPLAWASNNVIFFAKREESKFPPELPDSVKCNFMQNNE